MAKASSFLPTTWSYLVETVVSYTCTHIYSMYIYTVIYIYIYIFQMNLNKTLSEKPWVVVSYSLKTWGLLNNSRFQFETSLLNPFIFHPYETHMGIHANTTHLACRYPVFDIFMSLPNLGLVCHTRTLQKVSCTPCSCTWKTLQVSLQFNHAHREHRLPSTSRRPERKAWHRWLVAAWAGMDSWLVSGLQTTRYPAATLAG